MKTLTFMFYYIAILLARVSSKSKLKSCGLGANLA